jgi:hypothetical protein
LKLRQRELKPALNMHLKSGTIPLKRRMRLLCRLAQKIIYLLDSVESFLLWELRFVFGIVHEN